MKLCSKCNKEKSLEEFGFSSGKVRAYCKPCKVEWDKQYYKTNSMRRESVRETNRRILNRNRKFIVEYLKTHSCVDCGEVDIRVLEFDHLEDKISGVAYMARKLVSLDKLKKEMLKCEVRCCNCHRKITIERGSWWLGTVVQW